MYFDFEEWKKQNPQNGQTPTKRRADITESTDTLSFDEWKKTATPVVQTEKKPTTTLGKAKAIGREYVYSGLGDFYDYVTSYADLSSGGVAGKQKLIAQNNQLAYQWRQRLAKATDPQQKKIVQDQISYLDEENTRLQSEISATMAKVDKTFGEKLSIGIRSGLDTSIVADLAKIPLQFAYKTAGKFAVKRLAGEEAASAIDKYVFGEAGRVTTEGSLARKIEDITKIKVRTPAEEAAFKAARAGEKLTTIAKESATLIPEGVVYGYGYDVAGALDRGEPVGEALKPGTLSAAGVVVPVGLGALRAGFIPVSSMYRTVRSFGTPTAEDIAREKTILKEAFDDVLKQRESTNKLQYLKSSEALANAGIIPDLEYVNGKTVINTKEGISQAQEFIEKRVVAIQQRAEKIEVLQGARANLKKLEKEALGEAAGDFSGAEYLKRVKEIQNVFKSLRARYGNEIGLGQINFERGEMNRLTRAFNKQEFEQDAYNVIGNVFRNSIDKLTGDTLIRQVNREIGDMIQATKVLKLLNGKNVGGGRFTSIIASAVGAMIGQLAAKDAGIFHQAIYAVASMLGIRAFLRLLASGKFGGATSRRILASLREDETLLNKLLEKEPPVLHKAIKGEVDNLANQSRKINLETPKQIKNSTKKASIDKSVPQSKLGSKGEVFGVAAGIEVDDEGKQKFNPAKAALGVIGLGALRKVGGKNPSKLAPKAQSLLQEARKYKSAEEFVKALSPEKTMDLGGTYGYHGGSPIIDFTKPPKPSEKNIWMNSAPRGIYLTRDESVGKALAGKFADAHGADGKVHKFRISPDAKIFSVSKDKGVLMEYLKKQANRHDAEFTTKSAVAKNESIYWKTFYRKWLLEDIEAAKIPLEISYNSANRTEIWDFLRRKGYDGMVVRESGRGSRQHYSTHIWNTEKLKEVPLTEQSSLLAPSQLTDIWNKANKGGKTIMGGLKKNESLTTKFLEYAKGKSTLSKQEILDFARRPELKKGEADMLLKKLGEFEPKNPLTQEARKLYMGTGKEVRGIPAGFENVGVGGAKHKATMNVLGDNAIYLASDKNIAAKYGKVTEHSVDIKNPLVLKNDFDLYNFRKATNAPNPLDPMIQMQGAQAVKNATNQFQKAVKDAGYDAVEVQIAPKNSEALKKLFEDNQTVIFNKSQLTDIWNKAQSKIPAQEFTDSIRRDLLELKPVKVKEPQYKNIHIDRNEDAGFAIGDNLGKNYEEVVFESPITTNGSSHFPNSKNYFAHARGDEVVENGKKIWREQEIQSDLLQKEGMDQFSKPRNSVSSYENNPFFYKTRDFTEPRNLKNLKVGSTMWDGNNGDQWKVYKLDNNYAYIENLWQKGMKNKLFIGDEAAFARARQAEATQLIPFTNDRFGERIMRERIKEKASKGYSKYRLPTGETIGKIEGFTEEGWTFNNQFPASVDDLKVGKEIFQTQGDMGAISEDGWIITDILGDGRFKAVPKTLFTETGGKNAMLESKKWTPEVKTLIERHQETFDLTGKSNPQYRRYQDWGKFLKNKYGGKEVTDPQGNSWVEIDLKPEYKKMPIEAFGILGGVGLGISQDNGK